MEDNYNLLMMVLKYHYKSRPTILDEALRLLKSYSAKSNKSLQDYEETLNLLRLKMNDLPANILTYFLNMVPLSDEQKSKQITLDDCIETDSNIKSLLLSYLDPIQNLTNQKVSELNMEHKEVDKKEAKKVATHEDKILESIQENYERNIKRVKRTKRKQITECKTLLDLCSEYVVVNKKRLSDIYTDLKHRAWMSVNTNQYVGDQLQTCYNVIKDLNKKMKWIRMIDMDEVPADIIEEQYVINSDVLLLENNLYNPEYEDPFVVSKELEQAINNYIFE